MKNLTVLTSICLLLFLYACDTTTSNGGILPTQEFEKALQTRLVEAHVGETILLPEGLFELKRPLLLNDVEHVTIKGAGKEKTILSFKNQIEGAEGMLIKANGITLEGFTVQDTKGDAIKIQESENVIMRDLKVTWTNGALSTNGAYGLYPVQCTNVLMENCEASYAMDAGIYVGQSNNVIVRKNYAHHNVAGIEVENTIKGEVYENRAENNSGGMLIFDMPDLPQANGAKIKVFNNYIQNNNFKNFAAEGIVAAIIPPGTGALLMSHTELEFYDNEIYNHKTLGMAVVSWLFTQRPYKEDSGFDPFCSAVSIHDNKIKKRTTEATDTTTAFGQLVTALFEGEGKDIVTDGVFNPTNVDESGNPKAESRICIQNNGDVSFVNLNAAKGMNPEEMAINMSTDISQFDCSLKTFNLSGFDEWLTVE